MRADVTGRRELCAAFGMGQVAGQEVDGAPNGFSIGALIVIAHARPCAVLCEFARPWSVCVFRRVPNDADSREHAYLTAPHPSRCTCDGMVVALTRVRLLFRLPRKGTADDDTYSPAVPQRGLCFLH